MLAFSHFIIIIFAIASSQSPILGRWRAPGNAATLYTAMKSTGMSQWGFAINMESLINVTNHYAHNNSYPWIWLYLPEPLDLLRSLVTRTAGWVVVCRSHCLRFCFPSYENFDVCTPSPPSLEPAAGGRDLLGLHHRGGGALGGHLDTWPCLCLCPQVF